MLTTENKVKERLAKLEETLTLTDDGFIVYCLGHGFQVELNFLGTDCSGKSHVEYRFRDGGQLIFSGKDFSPSPLLGCPDSALAAISLCGFLALPPGDTEGEYFSNYTLEQLQWAKEKAELLAWVISDYEADEE